MGSGDNSAGAMHHVMTLAVAGSWLFIDDEDYEFRLGQFSDVVEKGLAQIHMYCLMGNHEHALITPAGGSHLCDVMHKLNREYAVAFNREHLRRGRVYGRPYEGKPVLSERYLLTLIPYIALNPERVGFNRAESYRWSSYAALIGLTERELFVDETPLLDIAGGRVGIASLIDAARLQRRMTNLVGNEVGNFVMNEVAN